MARPRHHQAIRRDRSFTWAVDTLGSGTMGEKRDESQRD